MNLIYQQRIVVDFARFDARQLFYLCFQQHVPKQFFSHMMASSTFQMSLFSTYFVYNNIRPANERVIMPVKLCYRGETQVEKYVIYIPKQMIGQYQQRTNNNTLTTHYYVTKIRRRRRRGILEGER